MSAGEEVDTVWFGDFEVEVGSPVWKRLTAEAARDDVAEDVGPPAPEKPLKKMNLTELKARATELELEFDDAKATKAELVTAIETKLAAE